MKLNLTGITDARIWAEIVGEKAQVSALYDEMYGVLWFRITGESPFPRGDLQPRIEKALADWRSEVAMPVIMFNIETWHRSEML